MTFEDYVTAHGHALLRLAFVLTGDAHRAEDLAQGVLTDAYIRWARVSAARHPHAYVRKMMINAHLDLHRRRSSTERPVAPETVSRSLHNGTAPDPADTVLGRDHLRSLVAELSPRARTVLVLRYYVDLDDTAIGDAMGISPGSVRSLASRSLAALRDISTQKETP